jgi:hypothetical protein
MLQFGKEVGGITFRCPRKLAEMNEEKVCQKAASPGERLVRSCGGDRKEPGKM